MSNREWLKQLAASETKTWLNAAEPFGLSGKHRLETCHTVYMFDDGVCVDVARRGEDEVSAELTTIGMRVVGFLMVVEGQKRLLDRWLPGSRAVLWRAPTATLPMRVALTSPCYKLVACSIHDEEEDLDDTARFVPPSEHPAPESVVRLFS
jgi:hypothetical protein